MSFTIRVAPWSEISNSARAIREAVFIEEQKVPANMEWDDIDPECATAIAFDQAGNAVGTGRLLPDGRIGRMAVLASHRGTGVGRAILETLIAEARERGFAETVLSAQTQARVFYEKSGFEVAGEEFMEAGIPHVTMRLALS
jgi:predicted GNAT family N-acyltransferase